MKILNYFFPFIPEKTKTKVVFVLVVLCSSILYFFGTGLDPHYLLTWLAPIPIFWYLMKTKSKHALLAGFLSYLLGSLNMFTYLEIHVPYLLVFLSLLIHSIVFTLGLWLFIRCFEKNKPLSLFVMPSFWAGYEFILAILSPHGTFGSLAYSQANFIDIIQIASVTGIWSITFSLFFVPVLFIFAIKAGWKYSIVLFLFISMIMFSSWFKLNKPQQYEPTLKVATIAIDSLLVDFKKSNQSSANNILNHYLQEADKLVKKGINILVLPEKILTVSEEYETETKQRLLDYTSKNHLLLVIGVTLIKNKVKQNVAWVFDEGLFVGQYSKHHLVPGWESDYKKGTDYLVYSKWGLKIGIAICKDMDFPDLLRNYTKQEVDLMLVPAWDFGKDARLHNNMALLRAVEGGFTIVRSASEGLLTVINGYGEIESMKNSNPQAIVSSHSELQLFKVDTYYKSFGNWFANLLLLYLLSIIAYLLFNRKLIK